MPMVEVGAVIPVSLEGIRALSLGDAAREGRILEARVTAMLSNSLARLAINGMDVDVATPTPLPVGASLTLRAERDGDELRLVTQGPVRDAAGQPLARVAAGAPDALMDPVRTVLAQVQVMAVQASLDEAAGGDTVPQNPAAAALAMLQPVALPDRPGRRSSAPAGLEAEVLAASLAATASEPGRMETGATLLPQLTGRPLAPLITSEEFLAGMEAELLAASRAGGGEPLPEEDAAARQPADARAAGQTPNDRLDRPGPDPKAVAAAFAATVADAGPEARDIRPFPLPGAELIQQQAAADAGGLARTDRPTHFVIELPLYFPGNPMPLRLEVSREEEGGEPDAQSGAPKPSWSIRFAAEAGPLGMIHAAVTMLNEQVGVQLWAERGATAALFQQNAPQLQEALQASDVHLDALRIAEGRPTERPSAETERRP